MSAEDGRQEYPVRGEVSWIHREIGAPRWYLRMQLRWVVRDMAHVERLLNDEFAILETAPLHAAFAALVQRRDELQKRLAPGH